MGGLRPLIIGLILVGLFGYALLVGGSLLIVANGGQSLDTDPTLGAYMMNISNALQNNSHSSTTAKDAFSNSSVTTTTSIPYVDSIGGIWKTLTVYPIMIYDLTIGLVFTKLISDAAKVVVISALSTIIAITIIFLVWKLIATGESDQ